MIDTDNLKIMLDSTLYGNVIQRRDNTIALKEYIVNTLLTEITEANDILNCLEKQIPNMINYFNQQILLLDKLIIKYPNDKEIIMVRYNLQKTIWFLEDKHSFTTEWCITIGVDGPWAG